MSGLHHDFISAAQIRAARGLLNWSQDELASAARLSIATIRKLELGHISPRLETARLIKQAFEEAGLEFLHPNGVRQKPEDIRVYQGIEGLINFYDDVYQTVCKNGGDIVSIASDPSFVWSMMGTYADLHRARMEAIKDRISVRCLMTERISTYPGASYCEYRFISKSYVDPIPFYVYGDKYGIRTIKADPSPKIVVVQSQSVAESFRYQFNSMWDKAVSLSVPDDLDTDARKRA